MKIYSLFAICLAALTIFLLGWFLYILYVSYITKHLRYETQKVVGKVVKKEKSFNYLKKYLELLTLPTYIPYSSYEEKKIYVEYRKKEYCINDPVIYYHISVGDDVPIIITKAYTPNGKIKKIKADIA